MRILFDTSVLVAAVVEVHPAHIQALPWLQAVKREVHTGVIAAHSLAELYAILTTLPVQPRIPPLVAQQLIQRNVLDVFEVVYLSDQDYKTLITHLADTGIIGGTTYDALILHAAMKTDLDQILTLNERDFQRVYPALAEKIVSP